MRTVVYTTAEGNVIWRDTDDETLVLYATCEGCPEDEVCATTTVTDLSRVAEEVAVFADIVDVNGCTLPKTPTTPDLPSLDEVFANLHADAIAAAQKAGTGIQKPGFIEVNGRTVWQGRSTTTTGTMNEERPTTPVTPRPPTGPSRT